MRLIFTAAVAALVLAFAGTAADAKKAKSKHYTFDISCPAIAPMPMSMGKCTASGKSKEAARTSCQAKHNFCYIKDHGKKKHAKKHKKHKKHMKKKKM